MSVKNSTPNMYPEVLEAIQIAFKDKPEIEIDCLLYLTSLKDAWERTEELSDRAFYLLEEMNRCPYCGEQMQVYYYQEPHPELDGCPMENRAEPYCPNCGSV